MRAVASLTMAAVALLPAAALAQAEPAAGWALDRYHPAPAGDALLLAEHPRYADGWDLAAALVLEHAADPLRVRRQFADTHVDHPAAVSGMFVAHANVAASFAGLGSADFSLPVSVAQGGDGALLGTVAVTPASGPVVGDVRVGGRLRLFGRAGTGPFSLHVGAWLWFPTGSRKGNTGDGTLRFEPRVLAAGSYGVLRWAFGVGVTLRREVEAANLAVGHELRLTGGATFALARGRVRVGPEFYVATPLGSLPDGASGAIFAAGQWGAEALVAGHVTLVAGLDASLGAGMGFERGAGIPAARVAAMLTWRATPGAGPSARPAR